MGHVLMVVRVLMAVPIDPDGGPCPGLCPVAVHVLMAVRVLMTATWLH